MRRREIEQPCVPGWIRPNRQQAPRGQYVVWIKNVSERVSWQVRYKTSSLVMRSRKRISEYPPQTLLVDGLRHLWQASCVSLQHTVTLTGQAHITTHGIKILAYNDEVLQMKKMLYSIWPKSHPVSRKSNKFKQLQYPCRHMWDHLNPTNT